MSWWLTEGTIIVRDDPDADLSGLNRDIDNAREITKDEEKYVDAYISPAAIAEVASGFEGIRADFAALGQSLAEVIESLTEQTSDEKNKIQENLYKQPLNEGKTLKKRQKRQIYKVESHRK